MQPLLKSDASVKTLGFNGKWDRFAYIITIMRHVYTYILIYYFRDFNPGWVLLLTYITGSYGAIVCGLPMYSSVVANTMHPIGCCQKFLCIMFWLIILLLQPFSISFTYIKHMEHHLRQEFYVHIFCNILYNGIPIAIVFCYYLVPHPAQYFNPSKFDQFIMIIYFIIFFFSVIAIYPTFMPLKAMDTKHLLFRLSTFGLNIIRSIFVLFLLVSYYSSIISVHPMVEYIYDCFLIQFFEITPILCIWIVLYTIDWRYISTMKKIATYWYNIHWIAGLWCAPFTFIFVVLYAILAPTFLY